MRGMSWAVVVATLAGCAMPAATDDGPTEAELAVADIDLPAVAVLADASGDAWETSGYTVRDGVQNWCRFLPRRGECSAAAEAAVPPDAGVVAADPAFDVLGVSVAEQGADVVFTLEVASLSADIREHAADGRIAAWEVCFDEIVRDSCDVARAAQRAFIRSDGEIALAFYERTWDRAGETGCNDWWWCTWVIPLEVEPGTPGRLVMRVPRGLLSTPDALTGIEARTGFMEDRVDAGADSLALREPATFRWERPWWTRWYVYSVDRAVAAEEYAFRSPHVDLRVPGLAPPGTFALAGDDSPLQPSAFEIIESPSEVTMRARFESLPDPLGDLSLEAEFAMDPGPLVYVSFDAREPGAQPGAWVADRENASRQLAVPVRVVPTYGDAPHLDIILPRTALGSPARGDRSSLVEIDAAAVVSTEVGSVTSRRESPMWFGAAPYVFEMDTASAEEGARTALLQDASGDAGDVVDLPAGQRSPGWERRNFDIEYVDATAAGENALRVTLGLRALAELSPPPGFDAVLYGVALRSGDASTLVGYHRSGADERGTFFCSEDTLVISEEGRVPARDFWFLIDGVLSTAEADRQSRVEGLGGGTIVFNVPPDCLGGEGTSITLDRIAAATYATRTEDAEARAIDKASADGPFTIETAVAAPARAWYAAPFGIDNFWDIFGIAAAVATTLVGALLVQRRRTALRKLLAEVEQAGATRVPAQRDAALRAIRQRIKDGLGRGSLSEAHYVIVERRLDELLGEARVAMLVEAFDELPHSLLMRLEAMLADGTMSPADHKLFSSLVERASFLTPEAKRDISQRAAAWVQQDAQR